VRARAALIARLAPGIAQAGADQVGPASRVAGCAGMIGASVGEPKDCGAVVRARDKEGRSLGSRRSGAGSIAGLSLGELLGVDGVERGAAVSVRGAVSAKAAESR